MLLLRGEQPGERERSQPPGTPLLHIHFCDHEGIGDLIAPNDGYQTNPVQKEAIERGQLVSILKEFCAPFPGYYLYYPQRRQASRALRALIDHLQQWRRAGHSRKAAR
jgi:DNA-binding transcriptional LysR family regulator